MNNAKILITGWSGTGKSTLARELKSRGLPAYDADDRSLGLCTWVEIATGKDVGRGYPEDYSAEKYDWRWKQAVLYTLLQTEQIIVCGNANNAFDFYHLFDKVFILNVPEQEQRRRMMARTEHDYGQDKVVQNMVIKRQTSLIGEALTHGATAIDASSSPREIANIILGEVS